jgi:hypothetical protein
MGWEVLRDPDREIMVFIDNTEDVAFGPIFYAFDKDKETLSDFWNALNLDDPRLMSSSQWDEAKMKWSGLDVEIKGIALVPILSDGNITMLKVEFHGGRLEDIHNGKLEADIRYIVNPITGEKIDPYEYGANIKDPTLQAAYESYLPEGLAEELGEQLLNREIVDTEGEGQFNGAFWGQNNEVPVFWKITEIMNGREIDRWGRNRLGMRQVQSDEYDEKWHEDFLED